MFCFFHHPQQQKNLEGYVGFASLPNQVYRKSVKRGFEFTLMVVGKRAVAFCVQIITPGLSHRYSTVIRHVWVTRVKQWVAYTRHARALQISCLSLNLRQLGDCILDIRCKRCQDETKQEDKVKRQWFHILPKLKYNNLQNGESSDTWYNRGVTYDV